MDINAIKKLREETSASVLDVKRALEEAEGDVVKAKIQKLKKSYGEAKTIEVLKLGEGRIKAKCKHFGVCGGCKQQDLDYEFQVKYKQEQVKDIFERLGGFSEFENLPIVKSEEIYHYRNKMDFSFTPQRWLTSDEINAETEIDKNFALGFHVPKVFSKVINIEECYLQSDRGTEILNFTRDYFKKKDTSIYFGKTNGKRYHFFERIDFLNHNSSMIFGMNMQSPAIMDIIELHRTAPAAMSLITSFLS